MKKILTKITCTLVAVIMAFIPVTTTIATQTEVVQAARAESFTVNGIAVKISPSVSDYYYNQMISWINGLPFQLRKNIDRIIVQDEALFGNENACGAQYGRGVYIRSRDIADGKAILYHEAAHILDYASNWYLSGSTTWRNIYPTEWRNAGYNSSERDSFAQAVSEYYNGGLKSNQTRTKTFVKEVTTGGYVKSGWKTYSLTGTIKQYAVAVYYGPSIERAKMAGWIGVGQTIKITGVNNNATWYRVWFNNTSCYVKAANVKLQ